MKAAIPALAFAVRHLLIVPFAIVVGCILWTITYVFLLAVAVIWNLNVGGPLAYPAGIVAIVGVAISIGWGIFTPASAVGAVICAIFKCPRLAAIPFVFGSAFVFSYLIDWAYTGGLAIHSMPSSWHVLKIFTIFLSVPLGACWWVTEGPGALFDPLRRWNENRRRQILQARMHY